MVSCIAGGFFTNQVIREALKEHMEMTFLWIFAMLGALVDS